MQHNLITTMRSLKIVDGCKSAAQVYSALNTSLNPCAGTGEDKLQQDPYRANSLRSKSMQSTSLSELLSAYGIPVADLIEPQIEPYLKSVDFSQTLADIYRRLEAASQCEKSLVHLEQASFFRGLSDPKLLRRSLRCARQHAIDVHSKVVLAAWLRFERREDELVGSSSMDCGVGRILECPKSSLVHGYDPGSVYDPCPCRQPAKNEESSSPAETASVDVEEGGGGGGEEEGKELEVVGEGELEEEMAPSTSAEECDVSFCIGEKMYLKKALWSEGSNPSSSDTPSASSSTPVNELVSSLTNQRLYREVTLALRTGLRDARAEFSFLRVRGLRNLLKFLRSVAESDSTIRLFCHSQSISDLQVVPVLFQNSLKQSRDNSVPNLDHVFSLEPLKITSPSTDTEIAFALRVLEGCCLLHRPSTDIAHKFKAIEVLVDILSNRGKLEQGVCLDALISIMLDSSANQMAFEACRGIEEVADLIKDKQADENIRLKCGEFLLIFIGHLNGRERSPMMRIHEDIRELLGERSASLVWAASQFGSTLDPEQRQTALHIQARRVLESLDMY